MRTSSRVLLNTATSWAARVVTGAVSVLLVPFLLTMLGREGYGLIALIGVIVSVAGVADLGVRAAMSRQLAEQVARGDRQRFNELISSGAFFYVGVGLACAAACAILAPMLNDVFRVPEGLRAEGLFLIRWYGAAAILLSFVLPIYEAVLTSNQRFDLSNNIATVMGLVRAGCVFVVLYLTNSGLYGWVAAMMIPTVLHPLVSRHYARRVWPDLRIRYECVRREAFGSLFSLGGRLLLLRLTGLLSVHADPLVLTTILGPAAVALYRPATALSTMFHPLVESLADQLHPLATSLHTADRVADLQAVLLRGTRYTMLMAVPVCVILGVFAHPITTVWLADTLGRDCAVTGTVLLCWALIDLFNYAAGSQWPVLLGMNRLGFVIWTQLPSGILNVVASVLLVKYTALGVVGVALPTLVIGALRRPVLAVYTATVVGVPPLEYLRASYARPLIVLLILTAAAGAMRLAFALDSLPALAAASCGVGLIWAVLCWFVGFNAQDRLSLVSLWQRTLGAATRRMRPSEGDEGFSA